MIKKLFILVLASLLVISGCTNTISSSRAGKPSAAKNQPAYYLVAKGDTLYSIAWQTGHDYRQVARWNNIRWPYRIHPGQRIYLTAAYYYSAQHTEKPKTKSYTKSKSTYSRKKSYKAKKKKTESVRSGPINWHWPTKGKVISYFSAKEPGKNGVDIAGRSGQVIKAAASGRVVYSGNGLRGYGNLVIIKHNASYFSAYAHNRRIYVKEDQKVKLGEKIADMGSTGANKTMLHFEIRKNGRPTNPLKYLPKT